MLIALLTILLLGGPDGMLASIKDTEKQIKVVMPKSEEQKTALNVLKDAKQQTKAFNKTRKKAAKEFSKLIESHNADLTRVDSLWSEYHKANHDFSIDSIDLRFRSKQQLSREEWSRVFPTNAQ